MYHKRPKTQKRKSGVTLILALMVMSAIVAVSITIVAIVVFQSKVNSVVTQSHQGYYVAESGMEQALNVVSTLRSGSMGAAITSLTGRQTPTEGVLVSQGGETPDNGKFKLDASLSRAEPSGASLPSTLEQNTSSYIELYNVDSSVSSLASPKLCIFADSADGVTNEVLEVSYVGWTTATAPGGFKISAPQKVLVGYSQFNSASGLCPIAGSKGAAIDLNVFYQGPEPAFTNTNIAGYRIRITALKPVGSEADDTDDGNVKNLTIYSEPPVNSQLRIKTTSANTFTGQQQALVAIVPWAAPLSPLFDFVIFSENTLEKNIVIRNQVEDFLRFGPFNVRSGAQPYPACESADMSTNCQSLTESTVNPFLNCNAATPCNLYIRYYNNQPTADIKTVAIGPNTSCGGVNLSMFDANGSPIGQARISNLEHGKSCIIKKPAKFVVGGSPPTPNLIKVYFTFPTHVVSISNCSQTDPYSGDTYELLTYPMLRDPNETFCDDSIPPWP